MKISLDWLRELVSWEGSPEELAASLTAAGLNVECVDVYEQTFPGVVVAKVIDCERHPNADKLSLCQVHDGSESMSVVCGAPNVRAGQDILLATPGTVLPNGLKIKKSKIRGEVSHGMICSAAELGLSAEANGIIELTGDFRTGTAADEIYGFRDVVLDIEVTPNRPDWLSHLGVAREVAALYKTTVTPPRVWSAQKGGIGALDVKIEVEDFGDCPRYSAYAAEGVAIGPAPDYIQNRLRALGARPINNVVDITNYVMFEMGQPMHAFDRKKLLGDTIYIKRAEADTTTTTLDGLERKLGPEHLIIADADGTVAIAGVMGNARSEVDIHTSELVLESAFFDPLLVRRASRGLGLISESSYRFEREADWDMVEKAAHRALYLLQEHASASVIPEWIDRQDPDRKPPGEVPLRVYQVNRLLGTDMETETAADILHSLGLKVKPLGNVDSRKRSAVNMMVEVPSYRRDVHQEVDLIEEIARICGFDHLGESSHLVRGGSGGRRRLDDTVKDRIRRFLASTGYFEMVTSSFMERRDLQHLQLADGDVRTHCLPVANPHHGGEILLRTSLLPSLLRVAAHNINAGNRVPVRLFQINKVFWPEGPTITDSRHEAEKLLPEEPLLAQIGIAGWRDSGLDGVPCDLLEIKATIDMLGQLWRVPLALVPEDTERYLAGGQQWSIQDGAGARVGHAGRVADAVLSAFDLETPVAVAELDLSCLNLQPESVEFKQYSRFPAVKRDLSLLVPAGLRYQQVRALVEESAGDLLESVELFDIYRGKELPDQRAAFGIRLKFRSVKGNLKGKTVDKAVAKIQKTLAEQLDVLLRS